MHSWLLSFSEMFSPLYPGLGGLETGYAIVRALPGWAYARALAFKAEGDDHASQVRPRLSVDKHSRKLIERDIEHRSFETSGSRVSVSRATLSRQGGNCASCRSEKSSSFQDIHSSRVCRLFLC